MKKPLALIAAILFAYQISNAQTQKGVQTLGFSLSYSHSANNSNSINLYDGKLVTQDYQYTSAAISPNYSYFIADGVELGGGLSYSHNTQNSSNLYNGSVSLTGQTTDRYSGLAYLRKYVLFTDKFGFRTGPFASYDHGIIKYNSTPPAAANDNHTSNGYTAGADFDLVYYPSKKMGIAAKMASVRYAYSKSSGEGGYEGKDENFGFNFINNGLTLALFYVIGNK
jgi:hypothetical protein